MNHIWNVLLESQESHELLEGLYKPLYFGHNKIYVSGVLTDLTDLVSIDAIFRNQF